MQIKKSLLIPAPSPDGAIFVTCTTYAAASGETLLQEYSELFTSDTFGKFFLRRSADNGRTWSPPALSYEPSLVAEGMLRRSEQAFLLDSARGRVIRFYVLSIYPDLNGHTKDVARLSRIWYDVTKDGGKTFSEPRQLIVEGGSEMEWAPDVCYGKNSAMFAFCQPFMDATGRIILPAQWKPVLAPDHQGPYPMQALCFLGDTAENGSISWRASERIAIEEACSVRGLYEPTVVPISGGKLLMVCRGSNVWRPDIPARKWVTTSTDGGLHWNPVQPFGYDTGELFYSPSSGSRLIRSSRNGRLYWIGNISPVNMDGNRPRYPLCIAEVDEEKLALRKNSVETIDTRQAEDTPQVQLSNFRVHEDRITGEFVLVMARVFERSEAAFASPAYEYRIAI